VVRELGITLWRLVLARRGLVVPASKGGKLKTVLQTLAVALYIMPLAGAVTWIGHGVMALAVAVTVLTGLQYIADSRKQNESSDGSSRGSGCQLLAGGAPHAGSRSIGPCDCRLPAARLDAGYR